MKFTIIKSCLARFSGIFALGTPSNIHGTAISYRCAKFGAFVNSVTILTLRDLTICRLKNILSFRSKLCLYNSFIMSHFHYRSSIWHHFLKSDSKKLDRLHERALRYLNSDESSQTSTPCDRVGYSLVDRRIQNLLIIVFKTILLTIIHLNI